MNLQCWILQIVMKQYFIWTSDLILSQHCFIPTPDAEFHYSTLLLVIIPTRNSVFIIPTSWSETLMMKSSFQSQFKIHHSTIHHSNHSLLSFRHSDPRSAFIIKIQTTTSQIIRQFVHNEFSLENWSRLKAITSSILTGLKFPAWLAWLNRHLWRGSSVMQWLKKGLKGWVIGKRVELRKMSSYEKECRY